MDKIELENLLNSDSGSNDTVVTVLKGKTTPVPSWDKLKDIFLPENHKIIKDTTLRPDDKQDSKGKKDLVSKITYAAERITARKFNQTMFTLPVKRKYIYDKDSKEQKAAADAIEAVYQSVRINGVNINRFRAYFSACEVATIWYAVDKGEEHNDYGFPTKWRFRCRSYSPMERSLSRIPQAKIYPLFDDKEDLIALSFEYVVEDADKNSRTYFVAYTDSGVHQWVTSGDKTEKSEVVDEVPIGKIQGVYWYLPIPVYDDLENNRSEIEFALSRQSDIIRKNTAPIIKIAGKLIQGETPATDQATKVYNVESGGDVGTVAPSVTSENVDFFVSTLKKNIDEYTQMPNLSLENTKGLGVTSGEALKTLMTDAYLRIGEEQHDIIWGFDRECNIIKSLLGEANNKMKSALKAVKVVHEITPFVMDNKTTESTRLGKEVADGLKPRLVAIGELNYTDDPQGALDQIVKEEKMLNGSSAINDAFEQSV